MKKSKEVLDFVSAGCQIGGEFAWSTHKAYAHYLQWAGGLEPLSRKVFVGDLKTYPGVRYGVHWIDGKARRGFVGLGGAPLKTHKQFTYERVPARAAALGRSQDAPELVDVQIYQFLSDCCEVTKNPAHVATCFDLFCVYEDWAEGRKDRYTSQKMLTRRIRDTLGRSVRYGVHWVEGKTERGFRGIHLR